MDMTFGEKLQELRRKNAMSQDVLAEKLEVSRQAVSKWERDEAMPETDKIVRIAQLFGVSTDYLLMNGQKQEPKQQSQSQHLGHYSFNSQRIEQFVRRHGYKGGYVLAGIGAMIDAISLIFRTVWQSTVSNMMGGFGGSMDSMFGNSFVPGFGMGDPMLDSFNQATQQMGNVASSWGNVFLVGLIPGTALITVGVYIIIKGKQLAQKATDL